MFQIQCYVFACPIILPHMYLIIGIAGDTLNSLHYKNTGSFKDQRQLCCAT